MYIYKHGTGKMSSLLNKPLHKHREPTPTTVLNHLLLGQEYQAYVSRDPPKYYTTFNHRMKICKTYNLKSCSI